MAKRKTKRRAPVRRRKVGATSTNTVLLIGAGLLAVYLISKPKPIVTPSLTALPPGYLPVGVNPVNTAITSGASVLNNLFNNL